MVVIIKSKEALSFPALNRLALKSIYEPQNMTMTEETQLHQSIVNWANHLEVRRDLVRAKGIPDFEVGSVDYEYQICLEVIGSLLKKNEDGGLEQRKESFKRHNIDYKKFHRLPESYKAEDFARGQAILEEHKKTNPEDYE